MLATPMGKGTAMRAEAVVLAVAIVLAPLGARAADLVVLMVPHSFTHHCRYALLAMAMITSSGLAGATSVDAASRVYPTVAAGCTCTAAPAARHWFERVLIIVLENRDYDEAIADGYLGQLAKQGASFINFHGLFHPSYPNYLAMVAGKAISTNGNHQKNVRECTIGDTLKSNGFTWKNYAQGYPANPSQCFKDSYNKYARKHVPFMSFIQIQEHECDNIVSAHRFDEDKKNNALPNYAFYTPDLNNDGHDQKLSYASKWLKSFLEPLLSDLVFMRGTLIIVTFDESDPHSRDATVNHIYTVFLGPMVEFGKTILDNYNHYNVLRTIEENFGLCPLGEGDIGAKPITSVWKSAEK